MATGNLVVPVVLWGHRPPTHCISAIMITLDQQTIVTGCHDGQLCVWDLTETLQIVPRSMLFGHSTAITCLSRANESWNKSSIISASENGELCLWDLDDGRCVEHTILEGTHTAIQPYQVTKGTGRESWVIVHGQYPDIHILDSGSLEVMFSLTAKVSPDWISALCAFKPVKMQYDVIIALTINGCLKVWNIKGNENKGMEPIFEVESKPLHCLSAQSLSCCFFTLRTVLIVCNKYWQVYDVGDFTLLSSMFCEKGQRWVGGEFIASDRVIIWSQEGKGFLYHLPSHCIPESEDFRAVINRSSGRTNAPPFLYCILHHDGGEPLSCSPRMSFFYGRRAPFLKLWIKGDSQGRVTLWKLPEIGEKELSFLKQEQFDSSPVMPPSVSTSLAETWNSLDPKPPGIIDQLSTSMPEKEPLGVTATTYIPAFGRLVCGREDGSIVLVPATQTSLVQLLEGPHTARKGWPPHRVLHGHQGRVTCLLYPHQESPRYDPNHLVSGGADFSVCLWDVVTASLLHTFSIHGGEVTQMLAPPDDCHSRVLTSICSVASDHSVALLSLRDRKCIMLASCHLFPVRTVKWRPAHDFLLVSCTNDTLYIWQMETGHLDRVVEGSAAAEILQACDESVTSTETMLTTSESIAQVFKQRSLTAIKNAAQRSIMAAANQALGGAVAMEAGLPETSYSLTVTAMRANLRDDDFHVLFFDTEALIVQLLTDKTLIPGIAPPSSWQGDPQGGPSQGTRRGKARSPKLAQKVAGFIKKEIESRLRDSDDSDSSTEMGAATPPSQRLVSTRQADPEKSLHKTKNLTLLPSNLTLDIAQLFMSCLHAWGLDPQLDRACLDRLGLLQPHSSVSFGLLSRGSHMVLMLPGWHKRFALGASSPPSPDLWPTARESLQAKMAVAEVGGQPGVEGGLAVAMSHRGHWELSCALSTQHLVSVISVANTLMSMNNASFAAHSSLNLKQNQGKRAEGGLEDPLGGLPSDLTPEQAQIKQGWSLLAALHCVLLPDLLGSQYYKPPQLEQLARRWQDRCLEVREAAQALLLAELRRIGTDGRQEVVNAWAPYLPNYVDPQLSLMAQEPRPPTEREGLPPAGSVHLAAGPAADEISGDVDQDEEILSGASPQRKVSSSFESRRKQALAIVMLGVIGAEFGVEIEPSRRPIGTKPSGGQEGFGLKDYSLARHTAKALTFLLLQPPTAKLPAHTPIRRAAMDLIGRGFTVWEPYIDVSAVLLGLLELCSKSSKHATSMKSGLPITPAADSCRTAHHALSLIATARPLVFITTVAREVARHTALVASTQYPAATLNTSPLVKSKAEILKVVDLLMEKMQSDVSDLLTEVMDIVVFCLDPNQLKARGLSDLFPAVLKFSMVGYCSQTRRVAVGAKTGAIALYEQKPVKCQMLAGHRHAVTALSFSLDGKYLASYSYGDNKLFFWQTGASLFGIGISSTVKCVKSYNTPGFNSSPNMSNRLRHVRLMWLNNKVIILRFPGEKEYKYTV